MRIFMLLLTVSLLVTACKSSSVKNDSDDAMASTSSPAVVMTGEPILVDTLIPYAENSRIAGNIKRECKLPEQLSDFIVTYAKSYDINVVQKPSVASTETGKVLKVSIVDSMSRGNAFTGHRKYTEIEGKLYQDGNLIGSFTAGRTSGGGAFAGFKGSCAVLGRTVKALGKDVAKWLRRPEMNSGLGEH